MKHYGANLLIIILGVGAGVGALHVWPAQGEWMAIGVGAATIAAFEGLRYLWTRMLKV